MKNRTRSHSPALAPLLALLASAAVGAASFAAEVPLGSPDFKPSVERPFGFRGDGSGRFPAATPPLDWSAKKNVRWCTAVGKSHSSPILTEKCVLVVSEPCLLLCLDRATGAIRWKLETKPTDLADEKSRARAAEYQPPKDGAGFAAATPITDGKNVYAVFANGIVRAVDLEGKPVWTSLIVAKQSTGYGRSASPIIADGKLIVHMTHLYAFDLATGKQLWVNEEATSRYGTPAAFKLGATALLVTPAGDVVRAEDGKLVASGIGRSQYTSPLPLGEVIYFCEKKDVKAVRLNAEFKDEELWCSEIEGSDTFGSPLLHEGTLYTVTSLGELYTFDVAAKGMVDPLTKEREIFVDEGAKTGPASVYASLTLAGKHFFVNSNGGETAILEANREAKRVAKIALPAGAGGSPVFSGKEIYLRDGLNLFCIAE
jgi:outer membrane protein assembly factor BamB